MCDVLSEVGNRIGVPAFYVSFVLAPLASNAAEVIASYSYAQKKTRKTMTISFSALIGAGNMNNTFCLVRTHSRPPFHGFHSDAQPSSTPLVFSMPLSAPLFAGWLTGVVV